MAASEIGRYASPPALPVVPVQPPSAPETPPDGQTGASAVRLAPVTSEAAAQVSAPAFDARPLDAGTPVLGTSIFTADPSVENFAEDYLNKPRNVPPETGRSDNVSALFSRNNAGRNTGVL
ncbi:hypothetical protein ACUSIJ_08370 [Pseudochelatococcus sp. B33]